MDENANIDPATKQQITAQVRPVSIATEPAIVSTPNAANFDDLPDGYFPKNKRWLLVLMIVGVLILSVINLGFGVLSLGLVFLYFMNTHLNYEKGLLNTFATANGYAFQGLGTLSGQNGIVFNIGYSQAYTDMVSGNYQNIPFHLFVYQFCEGSGKSIKTYVHTVMSVSFNATTSPFVLRRAGLGALEEEFDPIARTSCTIKLNLEGDFNKFFRLYIKPNSQVDVLETLSPDVMQALIGLSRHDVELTETGQLNIYTKGLVKKQDLINMYKIIEILTPKLGRYESMEQQIDQQIPSQSQTLVTTSAEAIASTSNKPI